MAANVRFPDATADLTERWPVQSPISQGSLPRGQAFNGDSMAELDLYSSRLAQEAGRTAASTAAANVLADESADLPFNTMEQVSRNEQEGAVGGSGGSTAGAGGAIDGIHCGTASHGGSSNCRGGRLGARHAGGDGLIAVEAVDPAGGKGRRGGGGNDGARNDVVDGRSKFLHGSAHSDKENEAVSDATRPQQQQQQRQMAPTPPRASADDRSGGALSADGDGSGGGSGTRRETEKEGKLSFGAETLFEFGRDDEGDEQTWARIDELQGEIDAQQQQQQQQQQPTKSASSEEAIHSFRIGTVARTEEDKEARRPLQHLDSAGSDQQLPEQRQRKREQHMMKADHVVEEASTPTSEFSAETESSGVGSSPASREQQQQQQQQLDQLPLQPTCLTRAGGVAAVVSGECEHSSGTPFISTPHPIGAAANSLGAAVGATTAKIDVGDDTLGVHESRPLHSRNLDIFDEGTMTGTPHDLGRFDVLPPVGRPGFGSVGNGGIGGGGGVNAFTLPHNAIGPVSVFSQALHMALALVVLVLVAFAKAGDGAIYSGPHGNSSAGYGSSSVPSSAPAFSSKRLSRGSGGGGSSRRNSGEFKQRRKSGKAAGKSDASPIALRVRAAWSNLWHTLEGELAKRWHAAGQALALLRRAWATLWVPPPHAEADVLAEALASPPRFSRGDENRWRGRRSGGDTSASGSSLGGRLGSGRIRRRSGRSSRTRALGPAESPQEKGFLQRPVGLNCLSFLSLCGYRPLVAPGRGRSSRARKFLLLLDLDETLVHCSPHVLVEAGRKRGSVAGGGGVVRPDLKLEMRGGAPSDRPASMYAWKRPHLDVFLAVVSRWYEVAVFTSGRQSFAEPLIDLLDSRCVIGKRFYRDSCVRRETSGSRESEGPANAAPPSAGSSSETVKDLRVVGGENFPLRMVLVDNQPRTVVQQDNVLPVRSWFPSDPEDRQLLDLLPVLLALTSCQDVRNVLGLRGGARAQRVDSTPSPRTASG